MVSDAALVAALREHGVRYFTADPDETQPSHETLSPQRLLSELAQADSARVRHAIAALFLVKPELAPLVPEVVEALTDGAKGVLIEAYIAAVYLQRAWRTRLRRYFGEQPELPPLWVDQLGLPSPDERFGRAGLAALHARQRRGATARHGAYEQVALNLFGQLVAERGTSRSAAA
ncbi:MAG TPA: hypothetical protein VFN74_04095 [Chloroflexota bacterium]|nr:hypothetical protein [Chloroflexota bacterium]